MKQTLLTSLRNKHTKQLAFRSAAKKLCEFIANDVANLIKEKKVFIQTPLKKTEGRIIDEQVVLVPILRSGMVMLPPFMNLFEEASVGFVGIKRDEKTALPHMYYENLPNIHAEDKIFILDPMIATGGSTIATLKRLEMAGANTSHFIVVSIISSQEGLDAIKKQFSKTLFYSVAIDPRLDKQKFIVPGLGDFGDRFFGT